MRLRLGNVGWLDRTAADRNAETQRPGEALESHFDPRFRSYDLGFEDVRRAARFLEELRAVEHSRRAAATDRAAAPNDHTAGTVPGKRTPRAMVADNDLALGRVLEGLSRSRFWPTMAVFVVEDDAQNGPDHVDAHRAVGLVVGPTCAVARWCRRSTRRAACCAPWS